MRTDEITTMAEILQSGVDEGGMYVNPVFNRIGTYQEFYWYRFDYSK